jgi:hypothetical protein
LQAAHRKVEVIRVQVATHTAIPVKVLLVMGTRKTPGEFPLTGTVLRGTITVSNSNSQDTTRIQEGMEVILNSNQVWEEGTEVTLNSNQAWEGTGVILNSNQAWEGTEAILNSNQAWEGTEATLNSRQA